MQLIGQVHHGNEELGGDASLSAHSILPALEIMQNFGGLSDRVVEFVL